MISASTELAYKTDNLLRKAERAREFGNDLSHEADEIRRDLERTTRDCAPEDRALCAVLDPSGLHLALRLDRVSFFQPPPKFAFAQFDLMVFSSNIYLKINKYFTSSPKTC